MNDHNGKTDEYAIWKNLAESSLYDYLQTENDQTNFKVKNIASSNSSTEKTESQTLTSQRNCTAVHSKCTEGLQRKRHDVAAVHRLLKNTVGETTEAEGNQGRCSPILDEITRNQRSMNSAKIEVCKESINQELGAPFIFDDEYLGERSVSEDQAMANVRDLSLQGNTDAEVVNQNKMKSTSLVVHQDVVVNVEREQLKMSGNVIDNKKKRHSLQFTNDYLTPNQRPSEKNESIDRKVFGAKSDDVAHSYLNFGRRSWTQREKNSKWHSNENKKILEAQRGNEATGVNSHDKGSQTSMKRVSLNSLEDALQYFGLWSHLQKLENSLEDVRRRKKSKQEHESDLKEIDKELQKLSFKFHPDKIKNRGCTEEELAEAHRLQAALNATRTVFNTLTDVFLSDLATDHKYGFYTRFNITSLGNEQQINNHIYEVLFEIGMLSEIKQRRIIAEIGMFLKESKCCVENYLRNKPSDFMKNRDAALYHLKCCIRGYKRLRDEFRVVENHCEQYERFENVRKVLSKTASESLRELALLRQLKKYAKESLAGNLKLYDPSEDMSDYFVQPFVYYINVILMCNTMIFSKGIRKKFLAVGPVEIPKYSKEIEMLLNPYYLASYCNGNKDFKYVSKQILRNEPFCFKDDRTHKDIEKVREAFRFYIEDLSVTFEQKFKADDYSEYSTRNELAEQLKNCMLMMSDFRKKEEEFSKEIDKLKRKTEKLEERYNNIMKRTEEHNQNVRECFERNRSLAEKTAVALSDNTMQRL